MKAPISVDESGDISTYGSVADAEMAMEPIDVEHGEYVVTDGTGRRLRVEIVTERERGIFGLLGVRRKKVRIAGYES